MYKTLQKNDIEIQEISTHSYGLYSPKNPLNMARAAMYQARLKSSEKTMSQCQVRTVRATISSSVRMREVKVMATTWTNSDSKSRNAPYIIMPPGGQKEKTRKCVFRKKIVLKIKLENVSLKGNEAS